MSDVSRNLSDLLVDYLEQLGVEYVFGVPGAHISALYEALAVSEKRGGPRAILTRHETGAANMADGYARETGKLGVCCATTGPGATNLVTGVASSYTDHTPLLVLTGQTPVPKFGSAAFQESSPDMMDTAAMLSHCTYYSSVITHPAQFEAKLSRALMSALRTPRGPAHLSIPVDVSKTKAPDSISHPELPMLLNEPSSLIDQGALSTLMIRVEKVIEAGKKVTILVGHDCAGATRDIMAFAEKLGACVISTQRGKTWVDPYHELARGVFGYAGHQSARDALEDPEVELILAAGAGLGQWSTSAWDSTLLNNRLVHIHRHSDYFSRSPMAGLHVQGDVSHVFSALLGRFDRSSVAAEVAPSCQKVSGDDTYCAPPSQISVQKPENYLADQSPLHPQRLVHELMQRRFPDNTRFIVDTTNWIPWTLHYFFTPHHEQYRLSSELAAMGWGIGAAVGTALAKPKMPVVCLVGDGGFLMNGQEITVAVAEKLPVIYMILNDATYSMVKHRHRQVSDIDIAFSFPPVDFNAMAKAMGADAHTVRNVSDLAALDMRSICEREGPTVLDVYIDAEATPPMGMF